MAKLVALYKKPANAAAFDAYCFDTRAHRQEGSEFSCDSAHEYTRINHTNAESAAGLSFDEVA